jgi:hypothetical protein
MKKNAFDTKYKLHQMLAADADAAGEHDPEAPVVRRLWELYGPKMIVGRRVPVRSIVDTPPQHLAELRVPVVVFKRFPRGWMPNAAFYVTDDVDPALYELFSNCGIEMVPLPTRYVAGGMLTSKDFRYRTKRAIFVPTEQPFRQFPEPKPPKDTDASR